MNLSCWSVLGIEPTDDIRAIKRAYAALAHKISPEDEPEKFRELHDAYKNALFFAEHRDDLVFGEFDDDFELADIDKIKMPGKTDKPEPDKSAEATVLEETTEEGLFPPTADTKPSEEDVEKHDTGFDFSSLDMDSVKVESAADVIIDEIVQFRESNFLTSKEAIRDLPHHLALHLSEKMYYMYKALANAANDTEVWDSFMEEPLIRYSLNFSIFRKWILEDIGEDSPYKDKLVKAFEKFSDDTKNDEIVKEKDVKPEPNVNTDLVIKIVFFSVIGILVIIFFYLLLFNKLTNELIGELAGGIVLMFATCRWPLLSKNK